MPCLFYFFITSTPSAAPYAQKRISTRHFAINDADEMRQLIYVNVNRDITGNPPYQNGIFMTISK